MEDNKSKIFLSVTSIISMLILLVGGTFSYFAIANKSDDDALAVEAAKVDLAVNIASQYVGHKLIPTNDDEIMLAYKSKCVDIHGLGACLAYQIEVSNGSEAQDLIGTIDFTVNGIDNLSYMLLDENGDIYLEKTSITGENTIDMPLGEHFILEDAIADKPASKKFVLIIWLTNLDKPQDEYDAGGTFSASITYQSIHGDRITGNINGYGEETDEVSQLEGE